MKSLGKLTVLGIPALVLTSLGSAPVNAQVPAAAVPVIVDTAAPIVVNAIKPKPKYTGLGKFEGYVMNANIAQITVRAKGDDMSMQTFALSQNASTQMQTIVDKGGYQYGDKVTIYYDPTSKQALKIKGKPSKPI